MPFLKKKPKKEQRYLLVNETDYKVSIYTEKRENSRVSITKTGINIRLGSWLTQQQKEEQITTFLAWAKETIVSKKISFAPAQKSFKHKDVLKLYDADIEIQLVTVESDRISGKINDKILLINLPSSLKGDRRSVHVSKMVARLLAKRYKDKIVEKLHHFNNKFELGTINQVKLKNNSTNWGSCSSKNNINVSVRLLLAPEYAVDYVLIHELCHLKHRNHRSEFWALVAKCSPEYLKAEHWLKKNSSTCII